MLGAWASFDVSKLAGMKINGAANALLLRLDLDEVFEAFQWWFEPTVRHVNEL
jgi:HNH endonuclease